MNVVSVLSRFFPLSSLARSDQIPLRCSCGFPRPDVTASLIQCSSAKTHTARSLIFSPLTALYHTLVAFKTRVKVKVGLPVFFWFSVHVHVFLLTIQVSI